MAYAEQPSKCLFFRVYWEDGHHEINNMRIVMDFPQKIDINGNYLIKLVDREGITIYQHKTKKFNIEFVPSREPEIGEISEELVIDFDELYGTKSGQMFFLLPYVENTKTLSFEHGTAVLASADLSVLCNRNGKCEESENYLSCPEDCALDKEDKYCHAYRDGVCDPDCIEGIDPDCEEAEPKPPERDFSMYYFLGAMILIVVVIIGYNLAKRKPEKSKH